MGDWVSAKMKLPPKYETVILTDGTARCSGCWNGQFFYWDTGSEEHGPTIAWLPLPDPPTPERMGVIPGVDYP